MAAPSVQPRTSLLKSRPLDAAVTEAVRELRVALRSYEGAHRANCAARVGRITTLSRRLQSNFDEAAARLHVVRGQLDDLLREDA